MGSISRAYSSFLRRYPTLVQSLQTGMLMGAGDVLSQLAVEKKSANEYEWQRTLRFFTIGSVIVGPVLKTWFGVLDRTFGSSSTKSALKKMAADQGMFCPCFLGILVSIMQLSSGKSLMQTREYMNEEYINILTTNYMIWPAVQIANFRFVPVHHQVLLVQVVALFWNTYLAWKTNVTRESQSLHIS